jgi:hypothetical protein
MKWWEQWAFNALHGVVAVTGVGYFYMKFLVTAVDPFSVINHPWQPAMLSLHLLAAPFFIAFFGMLFRSHTLKKITSPVAGNRRSGWMSLISFSTMALSGYLLQVASTPNVVTVMLWTHITTSVVFVAGYSLHLVIGWRISRVSSMATSTQPRQAGLST